MGFQTLGKLRNPTNEQKLNWISECKIGTFAPPNPPYLATFMLHTSTSYDFGMYIPVGIGHN